MSMPQRIRKINTKLYITPYRYICYVNGGQPAATIESPISDARHGVTDGYGGKAAATLESTASDNLNGVGNGDGGKAAATRESIVADARHGVSCPIICHRVGNDHTASVLPSRLLCHLCLLNLRY